VARCVKSGTLMIGPFLAAPMKGCMKGPMKGSTVHGPLNR